MNLGATRSIAAGIIGLLTVPVLLIAGVVALPLGSPSLPSGLLFVVALAGVASWIAGGTSAGWVRYGLGLAIGTLGALFVIAFYASSMTVENWLVSRDTFRANLALTLILITAAATIGYVAGALAVRRFGRPVAPGSATLRAISLPLVALAVVALGYPLIVSERALLPADAATVTLAVSADGRLTIAPTEFRAGPAIWRISSEFDRPLALVMVAVEAEADVARLQSGDAQGFTFDYFADAQPRLPTRSRFDAEPARYAIYFEEGGEGRTQPRGPIPSERLVIVDVRP